MAVHLSILTLFLFLFTLLNVLNTQEKYLVTNVSLNRKSYN